VKRIIPIVLLCIYLVGSGGIYYGYRAAQYYHFTLVRHLLINHSLQGKVKLLVISNQEAGSLQWKKKNKEFVYKGQMYDVARINTQKGKSFIYCYQDTKENRLISLFNQKKPGSEALKIILSKILLTNYILPASGSGIVPVVSEVHFTALHSIVINCMADIHSPPPKHPFFV
jgi:hypothetical protein